MSKDEIVREYVCRPSSVAVVGASPKEDRPVSGVMQYCMAHGFRVFPVNPQYAGSEILGQPCRADLRELPVVPDIVALFVSAKGHAAVLDSLRAMDGPRKPVVWMQPGAEDDASERAFREAGFDVVRDDCIMRAHLRECPSAAKM